MKHLRRGEDAVVLRAIERNASGEVKAYRVGLKQDQLEQFAADAAIDRRERVSVHEHLHGHRAAKLERAHVR